MNAASSLIVDFRQSQISPVQREDFTGAQSSECTNGKRRQICVIGCGQQLRHFLRTPDLHGIVSISRNQLSPCNRI